MRPSPSRSRPRVLPRPATEGTDLGPWNPGIRSQLPAAFLPLATIFRAENVRTGVEAAYERSAFTGLDPEDHVAFRPERLAVHETLIRVTADIAVPDGPNYEDLGISFREITRTILTGYVAPDMVEIVRAYADLKDRVARMIEDELSATIFASPGATRPEEERGAAASARTGAAPRARAGAGRSRRRARAPGPGAMAGEGGVGG